MLTRKLFLLLLIPIIYNILAIANINAQLYDSEKLQQSFTLEAEGDCFGSQLPGDFTLSTNSTQDQCATNCILNKECKGYSYNEGTKTCILKSIRACGARLKNGYQFYGKLD